MSRTRQPFLTLSVTFALLLEVIGCAKIQITRVRDDDYTTKGIRFYRPRPYLVVNKSFPVNGGDFFAQGTIDDQGRIISIDRSQIPRPVWQFFGIDEKTKTASLGPDAFLLPGQSLGQQKDTSGAGGAAPKKPKKNPKTPKPTTGPTTKASKSTTQRSSPTTTKADFTSTIDPKTDPLEKLNDYFSILYLPDFDQQYAISEDSGLGMAKADIQMRYGWMMEHATWTVDNTQLGQFIYSNIQKVIDLGIKGLETAIAPGSAQLASIVQQKEDGMKAMAGKTVLLRIRYSIEAEPGTYPILKPGEYSSSGPTNGPPNTSRAAVLLPLPPYTVVAYNYRQTVLVEVVNLSANATGKPNTGVALPDDQYTAVKGWLEKNLSETFKKTEEAKVFSLQLPVLSGDTLTISIKSTAAGSLDLKALTKTATDKLKDDALSVKPSGSDTATSVGNIVFKIEN